MRDLQAGPSFWHTLCLRVRRSWPKSFLFSGDQSTEKRCRVRPTYPNQHKLCAVSCGLGAPFTLLWPEVSLAMSFTWDALRSTLGLLSIVTVIWKSISRTVTVVSYILNTPRVKCLINHHIWSLLSLSLVMSVLTYSSSVEEVAGFNSLLLACQLLKWPKPYS